MTSLRMVDEKTGTAWRVWPEPESVSPGTVQEGGSYIFELHGDLATRAADLLIDDVPLEALRAQTRVAARWRWSPGFHAGAIEAELRLPGAAPVRFEMVTDPDKRKLTRDDFNAMVREILDDTFALFSLTSFRSGFSGGRGRRPPPIARLEFLRSRVEELEQAVEAIRRNPRHYLSTDEQVLPYYRANRATGSEVLRSFRSGRVIQATAPAPGLPPSLKGFMPNRIRTRLRVNSLDIPEHRQMRACLRAWSAWLLTASEQLERSERDSSPLPPEKTSVWVTRCRHLARRISQLAGATPFAEAGDASPRLVLSALFRNDPLYRRFYRIWRDMNLGIASVFGHFLNLPLARTFELYELWCFLRLARAATEEYGPTGLDIRDLFIRDASGGVTLAAGAVTMSVGAGWRLSFQKKYREYWLEPDRRGSYSRPMTPDIVATASETGKADRLIVLDAKYRINDGLSDSLSSAHTYRDGLVREVDSGAIQNIVSAAYLLTPHIAIIAADYRQTAMPARFFHPEYRKRFRFGAVTLRPGMALIEIAQVLRGLLGDSDAAGRETSVPSFAPQASPV